MSRTDYIQMCNQVAPELVRLYRASNLEELTEGLLDLRVLRHRNREVYRLVPREFTETEAVQVRAIDQRSRGDWVIYGRDKNWRKPIKSHKDKYGNISLYLPGPVFRRMRIYAQNEAAYEGFWHHIDLIEFYALLKNAQALVRILGEVGVDFSTVCTPDGTFPFTARSS